MAIQRERLNRKNAGGSYDTIHLETQADLILLASDPSKNVEQILGETVSIAKGGTGATTAAAGLYNLMAGLPEMTAEELAEDDLLCVLDVDANSAKMVALSVVGNGGGGTPGTENDWSLGGYVTWGGKQWIVVHVDAALFYLARTELEDPSAVPRQLQTRCNNYLSNFSSEELDNMVDVDTGLTHGKVFVASRAQMNGEFSYFNSDSRRSMNELYWTATQEYGDSLQKINNYFVSVDGRVVVDPHSTSTSLTPCRVRYFICVNYNGVVEITE